MTLDVGAVAEQCEHPVTTELGQPVRIDVLSIERRLVKLEVARVHHGTDSAVDGERDAVRHAVGDADELNLEGTDRDALPRRHGDEPVC